MQFSLADCIAGIQLAVDLEAQEYSWANISPSIPWQLSPGTFVRPYVASCVLESCPISHTHCKSDDSKNSITRLRRRLSAGCHTVCPLQVSF